MKVRFYIITPKALTVKTLRDLAKKPINKIKWNTINIQKGAGKQGINRKQNGRPTSIHISNYLKYKWSRHTNEKQLIG